MPHQADILSPTRSAKQRRRESVFTASCLVVGFLLLVSSKPTFDPSILALVSAQVSDDIAGIHGRFWKKNSTDEVATPVDNGSVFVTNTGLTHLYGEATTPDGVDHDAGSFQITKLPTNADLLVFYFDPANPGDMQVEELRLRANEEKELAPNDPSAITTRVMTAADLLEGMKGLVNKYLERALQSEDTETARKLKAHLDKLSLPAPEVPFHTEAESGGGLSGKTIAVIGAAAGGAGIALAAAAAGSDEAGNTPPSPPITTTTTTTTSVPASAWNCELLAIRADQRWMNTTRNVAEGNEARLRAWGTVTIDSNGTTATPDGSGQGIADGSAAMPGAPLHSLICAWDSNGNTKFFVGSETTVTVTVTGTIHCTVNEQPDRDSSYMDNSGVWSFEYCFSLPWTGAN